MRRPVAVVSLIVCALALIVGVVGPWITPYDPFVVDIFSRLEGPSLAHPFGQDQIGRDMLSRVIYGTRLTLALGVISVSVAVIIGVILGLASGGYGGYVDTIIMRLADLMLALPYFLLALTLVAAMGTGYRNSVIAISIWMIPHFTRVGPRTSPVLTGDRVRASSARHRRNAEEHIRSLPLAKLLVPNHRTNNALPAPRDHVGRRPGFPGIVTSTSRSRMGRAHRQTRASTWSPRRMF